MQADPFAGLEHWLKTAVAALEPGRRRQVLRDLGRELRKRNQRRMSRQTGPDGTPWAPRKRNRNGSVRKRVRMMEKLRQIRRLEMTATADTMELGYSGRTALIALVHQLGDVSEVAPGGPNVKYPARELLGLPPDDIAFVRQFVLDAIAQDIRP